MRVTSFRDMTVEGFQVCILRPVGMIEKLTKETNQANQGNRTTYAIGIAQKVHQFNKKLPNKQNIRIVHHQWQNFNIGYCTLVIANVEKVR